MPKTIRAQLADANHRIRELENQREATEFPLRRLIAERDREIDVLKLEAQRLRAEFRVVQVLAEYIGERARGGAGPVASGKLATVIPVRMPEESPPGTHFVSHFEGVR